MITKKTENKNRKKEKEMNKYLLTILAVIGISASANAGLQTPSYVATNNVPANSTNSYLSSGVTFSMATTSDATIQLTFKATDTNNSVIPFSFDASVDNSRWMTNYLTMSQAANGTNFVNLVYKLPLTNCVPFLRLNSVANTNSTVALTNVVVQMFTKTGL